MIVFLCILLLVVFSLVLQSMVHGVTGQIGQSVMHARGYPLVPESATAPLADLAVCPAWESADKVVVAMTTSPSAQVGITNDCTFVIWVCKNAQNA